MDTQVHFYHRNVQDTMVILEEGNLTPPTVPYVQHTGAVVLPKRTAQAHITVQEGGRAEEMAFVDGGGKGGNLKGVQRLWAHPQDGPIIQLLGESVIGGG